jgi:hypothetical protein
MAAEMKFGDYIKGGWEIVKPNLVPSVVWALIVGVGASIGIGGLLIPQLLVNYLKQVKAAKEQGKPMDIGGFFDFANFVPNFIAIFVHGLFAMCCGLPIALVYFTPHLVVDHPGAQPMDVVKGALAFGKANFVPCLLLMIVLGIVGQIGMVACGVGALVTMPVSLAAGWLAYTDHKAAIHAAAAEGGITLA